MNFRKLISPDNRHVIGALYIELLRKICLLRRIGISVQKKLGTKCHSQHQNHKKNCKHRRSRLFLPFPSLLPLLSSGRGGSFSCPRLFPRSCRSFPGRRACSSVLFPFSCPACGRLPHFLLIRSFFVSITVIRIRITVILVHSTSIFIVIMIISAAKICIVRIIIIITSEVVFPVILKIVVSGTHIFSNAHPSACALRLSRSAVPLY